MNMRTLHFWSKSFVYLVILLLSTLFFTGCAGIKGNLAMVATKDLDIAEINNYQVSDQEAEAKKSFVGVLVLPYMGFLFKNDIEKDYGPERLVDEALTKIPNAVAMLDAEYKYKTFQIPLLFLYQSANIKSDKVLLNDKKD